MKQVPVVHNTIQYVPIPGYLGYYASHCGRIVSTKKGAPRVLKPSTNKQGYAQLHLSYGEGKRRTVLLHRAIATTFLVAVKNKPIVNHIDGVKLNNNSSNLEWCTYSENSLHAISLGLITFKHLEREVHMYSLGGTYLQSFESMTQAANQVGTSNHANIVACCTGSRKHAMGRQWSHEKVRAMKPLLQLVTKSFRLYDSSTKKIVKVFEGTWPLKDICSYTGLEKKSLLSSLKYAKKKGRIGWGNGDIFIIRTTYE